MLSIGDYRPGTMLRTPSPTSVLRTVDPPGGLLPQLPAVRVPGPDALGAQSRNSWLVRWVQC